MDNMDNENTHTIPQKYTKKYVCEKCDYKTSHRGTWRRHILTRKHLGIKNTQKHTNDINENTLGLYRCQQCDYFTEHTGMWGRHLKTQGHTLKKAVIPAKSAFKCFCGKIYKYSSGLSKHRLLCSKLKSETSKVDTQMVETLLSTNMELQEMLREQIQHSTELMKKQDNIVLSTNSVTNNTTNNQFNINFFLNEQCKNALNLTDFINSLQVQIEDLNTTNKYGFVEGISNAFIRGLKELDMYQRPIHCSDVKRTIMYVKDDDQWSKEGDQKDKIKKSIKEIGHGKFIRLVKEWERCNPDWADTDVGTSEYTKMIQSVTRDLEENTENKIIKNIAREVLIDKQCN